jgi:hypothetical protein
MLVYDRENWPQNPGVVHGEPGSDGSDARRVLSPSAGRIVSLNSARVSLTQCQRSHGRVILEHLDFGEPGTKRPLHLGSRAIAEQ